jgi:hypothetical protein
VLRKQINPLATALGRVTTTLLATAMGISITILLVPRRQIKSGGSSTLEKVTRHQGDKPSTAESSTRKASMPGKTAAGEN